MAKTLLTQAVLFVAVCVSSGYVGLGQEQRDSSFNHPGQVGGKANDSSLETTPLAPLVLWHVDPEDFNDIVIHYPNIGDTIGEDKREQIYHHSTDGGRTWRRIRFEELSNVDRVWPYGFSPFTPPVEYRFLLGEDGRLSVSQDNAHSWQKIEPDVEGLRGTLRGQIIGVLARNPHDVHAFYIYVLGGSGDKNHYGHFKTVDGGRHFRKVDFDFASLWISPLDRNLMFAWSDDRGLHRSTDGGHHWKRIDTHEFFSQQIEEEVEDEEGKPTTLRLYRPVRQVAFDSNDGDTLYIITLKAILKTTDGGKSWHPLDVKLPTGAYWSAVLVVNPTDGQKLYLASDYDLRRSEDGGKTWRILPTPELPKPVNPAR